VDEDMLFVGFVELEGEEGVPVECVRGVTAGGRGGKTN
jgi:hypothetical protein